MKVISKLPSSGTSIFAIMSGLAHKEQAINLSQGFPDYPCDPGLISLVNEFMVKGYNQYAPMPGVLKLREQIAAKIFRGYQVSYDVADEITITAGATQAIYTSIAALILPGDEVIVLEPCYDSYVPAILVHGGIPVYVQLIAPHFRVDWDEVESKITPKTKMIMINTPHNPSGSILESADMKRLEEIIQKNDILLFSDEVYEHMIFDGKRHESAILYPGLRNRSIVCFSFGKSLHATGWKTGYCLAPPDITKEIRKVHQFTVFSCNAPMQNAIARYMEEEEVFDGLQPFFQAKRDRLFKGLERSKFEATPSKGTYFQLASYGHMSDETDLEFAQRITVEHGVATIPLSPFYHDGHDDKVVRLCFAKEDQTLNSAIERLLRI